MNSDEMNQSFEQIFGEVTGTVANTEVTVNTMSVTVTGLINRMTDIAERQTNDTSRQAASQAVNQVILKLKKMSSKQLAAKFFRVFGEQGAFNVFAVEADERTEMITRLLSVMTSDIRIEASMAVKAASLKNLLGIKEYKKTGRFDEGQIKAIRIDHLMDIAYRKIGKAYGVSGDMIRSICIGECYTDVCPELIDRPE